MPLEFPGALPGRAGRGESATHARAGRCGAFHSAESRKGAQPGGGKQRLQLAHLACEPQQGIGEGNWICSSGLPEQGAQGQPWACEPDPPQSLETGRSTGPVGRVKPLREPPHTGRNLRGLRPGTVQKWRRALAPPPSHRSSQLMASVLLPLSALVVAVVGPHPACFSWFSAAFDRGRSDGLQCVGAGLNTFKSPDGRLRPSLSTGWESGAVSDGPAVVFHGSDQQRRNPQPW